MKGWLARLRLTARIARRQVRRTARSSVLVVAMIALPVAALGAGAIIADSSLGTAEQVAAVELGQNEAYLRIAQVADPSLRQHPTDPQWTRFDQQDEANDFAPIHPQSDPPKDPAAVLPSGTRLLPVGDERGVRIRTAGGIGTMTAIVGDVWDPAFAGRFDVVAGEAPNGAGQIMATQAALDRAGSAIGDTVVFVEPALTATVTGVIDFAAVPDTREMLFVPWVHAEAFDVQVTQTRWYLPDLSLTWPEVQSLNPQGVTAFSRLVALDPPPVDREEFGSANTYWQTMGPLLLLLGAGAVFAAYQVALLAGAAFAVSSRRQRQSLATAASVGAAPAEVRRIVLLQGTVLGLIGGLIGLAVGALAAAVFLRLADTGNRTQFWGYNVPWWLLAAIALFAVVVGTFSALIPARGAAKADVLEALRGSRKPQHVSVARPVWGSVLLVTGLALTVVGVILGLTVSQASPEVIGWDSPLRWLPYIGIIAGPLLAQIGIILAGAWILHVLARGISRLGLGARLASRDAAANAARSVPAFASIAAAVFISVFAFSMLGASFAQNERNHVSLAPLGSVYADVWAATPAGYEAATDVLAEELRQAGARAVATVGRTDAYTDPDPDESVLLPMASYPASVLCDPGLRAEECDLKHLNFDGSIAVVAPDDLATVLGIELPAATLRAYTAGSAISVIPRLVADGEVQIGFWPIAQLWRIDGVTGPTPFTQDREDSVSWLTVPALTVDAAVTHMPVLLAPATADALGITVIPQMVIGAFDEPPSTRTVDAINQAGNSVNGAHFWVQVERGADQPWPWYLLIGGIAGILVLGASAVSIGLARFDGRADDATLAAVGGSRGIRRSISFWQAIVICGVGALVGATTGLLPSWGFVEMNTGLRVTDFPWLLIGGLAVGLPLLVATTAWLVSPRPAVLTRRTAIA